MSTQSTPDYVTALRERQAQFKASSATISDAARTAGDSFDQKHAHLLAAGYEEENLYPSLRGPGGAVAFFQARGIAWWRGQSSGDNLVTSVNPTRNLSSSQVCCVNFLLPLASVPGALEVIIDEVDPGAGAVVPLAYNGFASLVEFEWAGLQAPLEVGQKLTRGQHVTNADALIVAEARGGRCAYLFEWKLGEEYSGASWKGEGVSGDKRRGWYAALYTAPDSSFIGDVPLDNLLYEPHSQLLRLRLLADQMVRRKEFDVTEAKVVLVCPTANIAYLQGITSPPLLKRSPHAVTVEDVMRSLLRTQSGFIVTSPEAFARAISRSPLSAALAPWLSYQAERYGW